MAIVFVLIAFGGFTPSYWAPLAGGGYHPPPIVHIHGALLFGWTLFYLAQTAAVAAGRPALHRALGLAGIALFTLLVCSIVVLKITMMRIDDANGMGEASRRFAAIAMVPLPVMIGLFGLAIANVQRPEIHKRLMYSLMCAFMIPAIARVFVATLAPPGALDGGPPPPFVALPPTAVALLLFGVALTYDWRTQRRLNPVYLWSGAVVTLAGVLSVLVARTDAWLGVAASLQALAG
jgi:hypothetical protein